MPRPHISNSQIGMYFRCGLQYWHRYVQGVKAPPSVSLIVGSSTHATIEQDLTSKIVDGVLLPDEAIPDLANDAIKTRWDAEPPTLTLDEVEQGGEKAAKGKAIDKAIGLASLHHRELAPHLEPAQVEREWRVEVTGYPFDLMGFIDVQEEDGTVRDVKTAGKSPAANTADCSDQLTLYHLAVKVLDGRDVALSLDTLVDLKTPKIDIQQTTRTWLDHQRLLDRLAIMHDAISKGVFPPAPEGSWVCSERFCGYWHMCPFGRKGRSRT